MSLEAGEDTLVVGSGIASKAASIAGHAESGNEKKSSCSCLAVVVVSIDSSASDMKAY